MSPDCLLECNLTLQEPRRSHTDVKRRHLYSYFKAEIFTVAAELEELDVEDVNNVFSNHFVMSEEPFYICFFTFYLFCREAPEPELLTEF